MLGNTKRGLASVLIAGSLLVSGCSEDIRKSGYFPLEQELDSVNVGGSSREDVLATLGSPSVNSGENDSLIYIGQRTRHIGPFPTQVVERQIIVVSFDSRGQVANVQTLGLEDGQVVVLSQRVTEQFAGNLSFFKQLFGNIGRVDASQLLAN